MLGFPLVAAAVAAERVLGRVEALPRGPHAEAVGTLAVHGGAVILEHVLGVDALLGREPVFAHGLRVGQRRPVLLRRLLVDVRAVLQEYLDELDAAVDAPEDGEIARVVLVVGVGARSEQRLCRFDSAAVARGHERRVPVRCVVRLLEDEVDVRALLDLLIDELDVVLCVSRGVDGLDGGRRADSTVDPSVIDNCFFLGHCIF